MSDSPSNPDPDDFWGDLTIPGTGEDFYGDPFPANQPAQESLASTAQYGEVPPLSATTMPGPSVTQSAAVTKATIPGPSVTKSAAVTKATTTT
jgi:hypothetical protein